MTDTLKVRATLAGYLGSKRRDPGEEFSLSDAGEFSSKWMEPIGWKPSPLDHDGNGKAGGTAPANPPAEGLAAMTVVQLKALAKERGVDLGGSTAKADIIAALELAAGISAPVLTDDEKIAKAKELTGRTDIETAEQADEIIAAAAADSDI